jgi:hypothetical protein
MEERKEKKRREQGIFFLKTYLNGSENDDVLLKKTIIFSLLNQYIILGNPFLDTHKKNWIGKFHIFQRILFNMFIESRSSNLNSIIIT